MSKRVLLIGGSKQTFITNAVKQAFLEQEYEVEYEPLKVNRLSAVSGQFQMILLCLSEEIHESEEGIVYLKDYCTEKKIPLCVVGYDEEIEFLQTVIQENLITAKFIRPLNVKDLIEKIDEALLNEQIKGHKKHILLVDDSGTTLRTIKSWLSDKYKVSMAGSGAMAISFLATNHPDLILLDYEMPICSGPQFMEMIRAEVSTSSIPVIFLTSKGDRESVEKVLALKPAGYLLKTMKPEEILSYIDQFFEKNK